LVRTRAPGEKLLGRSDVFAGFNAALVVAGEANDHSKRCPQGVCAARRPHVRSGSVADVPGARRDVGLVPGIDPNARDAPSTAYYLIEAKKFIQRARHADNPDVTQTDLEMAEWLLPERLRKERTRQPRASQVKLRDARVPEALLHCRPIQPAVQEPTLINSVRRSFRAR